MRYSSFLYELFESDTRLMESIVDGYYTIFEAELTPEDQEYIDADPTPNKKYRVWILRMKKAGLKKEDLYKIKEYLTIFDKYKQKLDVKDINQYKSVSNLFAAIKPIKDAIDAGIDIRSDNQKRKAVARSSNDIDVVYESNGWKICHPKNKDAACLLGKDTEWCTATRSEKNMFDTYNERGPMYVLISPDGNKWQFHNDSHQFMDTSDENVTDIRFIPTDVTSEISKLYDATELLDMKTTDEQSDIIISQITTSTNLPNAVSALLPVGSQSAQRFVSEHIHELDDVDLRNVLTRDETFSRIIINCPLSTLEYLYENHPEPTHKYLTYMSVVADAMHVLILRDEMEKFVFVINKGARDNVYIIDNILNQLALMISNHRKDYYDKFALYLLSNEFELDDGSDYIISLVEKCYESIDQTTKLSSFASDEFTKQFINIVNKNADYMSSNGVVKLLDTFGTFIKHTSKPDNVHLIVDRVKGSKRIIMNTLQYLSQESQDRLVPILNILFHE